ncbi:hypothetical protein GC176_03410 [bacterium]|nr:hypothetical protein [bacterium]
MAEQLFERLSRLRQRVRYVLWVYGLCSLTIVLFGSIVLAGGLDLLVRIEDHGVRLMLSLGVVSVSGWAVWRFLWRPLSQHFSNVDLARRIERRHPEFADCLSSTVQFLESNQDPRSGSPELQRAVIRSTLASLRAVSVAGIVETRPVQRLAVGALAACLITVALIAANQAVAGTAINRLLFPLSSVPWPREVELRFVNRDLKPLSDADLGALTAVQGETLELFVENMRGELPDDLRLLARQPDGEVLTQPMRQATLRNDQGDAAEIGGASLLVTDGPLFIWALGGDGETVPLQIDVVPPPRVDSFRLTVQPPSYTGKPQIELPENVGDITGVAGTKIQLTGRVNKALASAGFHQHAAAPLPLTLAEDGRTFTGEVTFERSGSGTWWLALRDRQNFENPEAPRYDLQINADAEPSVLIELPETDLLVTATAQVPLRAVARDDLAVQKLWLEWEASNPARPKFVDPAETQTSNAGEAASDNAPLELVKRSNDTTSSRVPTVSSAGDSDQPNATLKPEAATRSLADGDLATERLSGETNFDLKEFDWPVGTRIVLRAAASDWFDLAEGGHVARSNPRALTIVSPEEKRSELADRQAALVLELERSEKSQLQNRELVRELQVQLEQAGQLRPEDRDLLKRIELDQRQIGARLVDDVNGLQRQAAAIRTERNENHVEDSASDTLLGELLDELAYLKTGPLPEIDRNLSDARKLSSDTEALQPDERRAFQSALDQVEHRQGETQRTLSNILDRLSQWRSERNLNAELRSLSGQQRELGDDARSTAEQTRGRPFAELSDQDRANLSRLGSRQQQMAEQVDAFRDDLTAAAESLKDSNPEQAARFDSALKQIDESGISAQMRQAAAEFGQNRVGEATATQQRVLEEMRKVQDALDQREATDTESLIKQLKEAADALAEVRQYEDALRKKLGELAGRSAAEREALERLQRQQQRVREKLQETVRRLQRLQSPAGSSAQRSANQMERSEAAVESGDLDAASDAQQQALDDLEQAQRELAADQKAAEETLAREQLEKLSDQLDAFLLREESVIAETRRLETARAENDRWNRTLLKSLRNLVGVQQGLAEETRHAAQSLGSIEVLKLALEGAASLMDRTAERLDARDTSIETVRLEERILKRFADLKAALAESKDEDSQQPPNQQPQEAQNGESGPNSEMVPIIAQLKVIRSLQADLIDRVTTLRNHEATNGRLSETDLTELDEIAGQQAILADLARELTAAFGDPDGEEESLDTPPTENVPNGEPDSNRRQDQAQHRSGSVGFLLRPLPEQRLYAASSGLPWLTASTVELTNVFAAAPPSDPGIDVPPAPNPKPSEPPKASDLDRELLNDLIPDLDLKLPGDEDKPATAAGPLPDELDRAVRHMRDVSNRLDQHDVSEETTRLQTSILSDIDALIERLKNQPPPQNQSSNNSTDQTTQQPRNQSQPQQQPQNQSPSQQQTDQPQSGQSPGKSAESEAEQQRDKQDAESSLKLRRALINEVWGHLPPSVREKLLNVPSEKLLPQYDTLIRRYYESLAESAASNE